MVSVGKLLSLLWAESTMVDYTLEGSRGLCAATDGEVQEGEMATLLDPQRSRAVLIGASSYHSADLPALPAVRNNLSAMASVLTAPERGGLPRDHCSVVVDPNEPRTVIRALREAERQAQDTLLVYYAGHGLLGPRLDALFLATTGTELDDLRYSALHIDAVREVFLDCHATNRVLILDCCFSGRAIAHVMGNIEGLLLEKVQINGTCIMASTPANWPAVAPREARYTAYTGALIDLLREGIVGGPEILSIRLVHERLSQIMTARGLPEPQLSATNTIEQLGLVRNSAYRDSQAAEMPTSTNPVDTHVSQSLLRDQVRFRQRTGCGWFDRMIWRLSTWGPLAAVIYSWHVLQPAPRLALVTIYALLSVFVFLYIYDLYPIRYDLIFDNDGIELVVGTTRSRYPWHRVREARLVQDNRHTRRSGHVLVLELQPGTLPLESRFLTQMPRWDHVHNGIRFAETARLAVGDDDIERALGRFGDGCWKPAQDISLTGDAWNYRTRGPYLAAWATVLLVLGLSPLLLFCGLFRGYVPIGTLSLATALAGILSIPGIIVATWARFPGHLKFDGEGIEISLGGRISRVAWHDMERVGVTGWLQETPGDRLLVVRKWPSSSLPSTRVTMPWTFRRGGTAVLCPVQVFTANADDLRTGLSRFAGSVWESGTGLHVPVEDTARRVRFTGRFFGPRAMLAAVAGFIVDELLVPLLNLLTVPSTAARFALPYNWGVFFIEIGIIVAGIVLARDRFDLILDANGVTLQIGRAPTTILWDEMDRITIISSFPIDGLTQTLWSSRKASNNSKKRKMRKDRKYLVAWLGGEVVIPRRWWRILGLMRPVLGGVSIMELGGGGARLFAGHAEIERALARFSGTKFASGSSEISQ